MKLVPPTPVELVVRVVEPVVVETFWPCCKPRPALEKVVLPRLLLLPEEPSPPELSPPELSPPELSPPEVPRLEESPEEPERLPELKPPDEPLLID
jgi:hypothetical protein